jgi:hypothetical protein
VDPAAAGEAVLAHLLEEHSLECFLLELVTAVDERRRHRGGEAVLEELRRRDLQQRAVVEVGIEQDIIYEAQILVGEGLVSIGDSR